MPRDKPMTTETQVTRLIRVARAVRELLDYEGCLICDPNPKAVAELEIAMQSLQPSDFDDQRYFYPQTFLDDPSTG